MPKLTTEQYVTRLIQEGLPFTIWRAPDRQKSYVESVGTEQMEIIETGTRAAYWDDWDAWLWEYRDNPG